MSDTVLGYSGEDRRSRRRFQLPGRAPLSWLVSGVESLVVFALLLGLAGAGTSGAFAGALVWLVLAYPTWYGFVRGLSQTTVTPPTALLGWSAAFGLALAVGLVFGARPAPGHLALGALGGLVASGVLRTTFATLVTRLMRNGRLQLERIGLVGRSGDIATFIARERVWRLGLQPVMAFASASQGTDGLARFMARCVDAGCSRVMFVSDSAERDRGELTNLCKRYSIDADFVSMPFDPEGLERIAERPVGFTGALAKRAIDLLASMLLVIVLAPFLALAALAIRLESPGPILFRQERVGFNGRSFMIYKFRSMRVMEDGRAMRQVQKDDDRVTRVGRFLRASSIDELPQLFNVLRGEMSLVGQRPHAVSHDSEMQRMIASYAHRNRLKPGISGWAQVNGYRGDTSTREKIEGRVAHDLYYIENWSILFDVYIALLTVFSRKARQNAY